MKLKRVVGMILSIKDREVLAKVERIIMKEFATEREYYFEVWECFNLWELKDELYHFSNTFVVYKNLLFIADGHPKTRYAVYDLETEQKIEEFIVSDHPKKENEIYRANLDNKIEEIVKKYAEE
jgi:hypothetical protein